MRLVLFHIFLFVSLYSQAQGVYGKVRRGIAETNPAHELYRLDSCYNASYFKDSALYYKTLLNLKLGNNQSAGKCARLLEKLYPGFNELHYLKGLVYFSEENYGKSVEEFNLALKDNPKNVKVYYNRSVALGLMDEYLSAIEDLNTCIELNPDYVLARYSRAYWYEFTGNYAESIKDYETVIRLDPKNYDAYLGLANVCKNQNEHTKACEAISRAINEGSQIASELKDTFCK